jgi:hypothetical protein
MLYFTLLFNDGTKQLIEASTKDAMIMEFCKDDCTQFQEKVKEIHWTEGVIHYIENIYTGDIKTSIATDTNPPA